MKLLLDNFSEHIACKRMLPYWKKDGIKIVGTPENADAHLVRIRATAFTKVPMFQRLDGIYYNTFVPYKERNRGIGETHARARGVIYQSRYSKEAAEYYLKKRTGKYTIIYNGIEREWCGKPIEQDIPNIIVVSGWRRHKRLQEIIEIFFDYLKEYPKAILHVIGNLYENNVYNHSNIRYYEQITYEKMKPIFQKALFSLHLSKRDACPNSVVEAIGAGIPVITTNACGGSTEMCNMTEGCRVVDGDEYTIEPVPHYTDEYNKLSKQLHSDLVENMIDLTKNPVRVELPEQLTVEYMAKKYIEFMRKNI